MATIEEWNGLRVLPLKILNHKFQAWIVHIHRKTVAAISHELGLPIVFIGTGEGLDDLSLFDTDDFVDALFGDEPVLG